MTTVLFAKESDCEENPGGLDLRATLVPDDVGAYVASGFDVVIEAGLGARIGYIDAQYEMQGARVESYPICYSHKDLVVKLKGPSATEIAYLSEGTTLFSMGHLYCFPERTRLLADKRVRLIGMETIATATQQCAEYLAGIEAGSRVGPRHLGPHVVVTVEDDVPQQYVNGLLRSVMRYGRQALHVTHVPSGAALAGSDGDCCDILVTTAGATIWAAGAPVHDLNTDATDGSGDRALLAEERAKTERAIGQIREVGIGGAKYGLELYRRLHDDPAPRVLVLGYGNVSMGAFEHLRTQGLDFTILGRPQTCPGELPRWLTTADVVINGAESPGASEYIVSEENTFSDLAAGSVLIDLIGGSPYKRSPVEAFRWTTFLPEIHFEFLGRYLAGLWGWDMYYSMHDTAKEYSRRISETLNRTDRYAKSLDEFVSDYAYAQQLGG